MYFYNSLLLIINILILTIHIQSQKQKGPGISGCYYIVSDCNESVTISQLPDDCSSLMFSRLTVDLNYHIYGDSSSSENNAKYLAKLDALLLTGKPVYVCYGYSAQPEWTKALSCYDSNAGNNSLDEMNSLKTFMANHTGIAGLILQCLDYDENSIPFKEYSEKLQIYLQKIEETFPDLEIGVEFYADVLIVQYTSNRAMLPWLDIKKIDPHFDFYIIDVSNLNNCEPELVDIGIAPINSSTTNYNTMDTVLSVLVKASIPKEKTYYGIRMNPLRMSCDTIVTCKLPIQEICLDKNATINWCMENMTSFNEKGRFSKKNGMGFVAYDISSNDPENQCKCEKPFPCFHALLDGFNDVNSKSCALL